MHLHALQQAHHSAAQRRYAPALQQDALALQTRTQHHVQQTALGQWQLQAADGLAVGSRWRGDQPLRRCLVQRFPKAQNFGTLAHFLGFTLRSSP